MSESVRTGGPDPTADATLPATTPPLIPTLVGLGVGVLGLVIQWIAAPEVFAGFGFPPGILFVVAAGGIMWLDRRAVWAPVAAVGLALWIVVGGLAGGGLTANLVSGNAGTVVGNVVMALGLIGAAVAGGVAIARGRRGVRSPLVRPVSAGNPRRTAVLVTVAGLLAAAIGDGAPEGLNWDGPGPVLFGLLAVLVAVVPGRSMLLLAALMSLAFAGAAVTVPESVARLSDPSAPVPFWFTVLQVVGLVVAVLAGVLATVPPRRRRGARTDAVARP